MPSSSRGITYIRISNPKSNKQSDPCCIHKYTPDVSFGTIAFNTIYETFLRIKNKIVIFWKNNSWNKCLITTWKCNLLKLGTKKVMLYFLLLLLTASRTYLNASGIHSISFHPIAISKVQALIFHLDYISIYLTGFLEPSFAWTSYLTIPYIPHTKCQSAFSIMDMGNVSPWPEVPSKWLYILEFSLLPWYITPFMDWPLPTFPPVISFYS